MIISDSETRANRQKGMVLLTALIFLLLLTSIATVSVNQMTLSPRMLANAEIKALTFNSAQGKLAEISVLPMEQFHGNDCSGKSKNSPYNPIASTCDPGANDATVRLVDEAKPARRTQNASGSDQLINDYFQVKADVTQSGISTVLIQDSYKSLWQGGSTGSTSNSGSTSITVSSDAN